jgi:hypothetical protein
MRDYMLFPFFCLGPVRLLDLFLQHIHPNNTMPSGMQFFSVFNVIWQKKVVYHALKLCNNETRSVCTYFY